jgi:hypothetical protein
LVSCADPSAAISYESLARRRARLVIADLPDRLFCAPQTDGDGCNVAGGNVGQRNAKDGGHVTSGDRHRTGERVLYTATGVAPPRIESVLGHFAFSSVDGALHFIGTNWRRFAEATRHGAAVYSELIDTCVWCVPNPTRSAFYHSGHGLVLVFKNGTGAHVDNVNVGCGVGHRSRSNVWSYPAIKASRRGQDRHHGHPSNGKPVALAADIIKDASRRGEVVLASFAGAGTVLLAAEQTGRRAVVIDDDPRRIDLAIQRWQSLTGKPVFSAHTGEAFAARAAVARPTGGTPTGARD